MKITKKILAFVLSFAMFLTCVNVDLYNSMAVAITKDEGLHIKHDGEVVDFVSLPQHSKDKLILTVENDNSYDYQWQLAINGNVNEWVGILDQTHYYVALSWAMLVNIVDAKGSTYIRCKATKGDTVIVSDPVLVTVAYDVEESNVSSSTQVAAQNLRSARSLRSSAATQALDMCTIEIKYVYADGSKAWDSWTAEILVGSDYTGEVKFPTIVGYLPYFEDNTESTTSYIVNETNAQESKTYTVTYKPTNVSFTIEHYVQNVVDDNYTLYTTTTDTGLTGSEIGSGREMEIDGYTMLYYDKTVKIAADGSTVVEIYYDCNYYLMYFDLDGGYGTDPIYTRYGATVSVNNPIRHGYVFGGWELISVGVNTDGTVIDRAATDEEKTKYDLNNTSITLPAMNLRYKAKWGISDTTYTVVYWTENADDDGYSYLAHKDVASKSAAVVSGSDDYSWDKEDYFTYNAAKTDKNVIVEGDGSTVVNVYYTRNIYYIYFKGISGTCAIEEHTHGTDCDSELACTQQVHTHDDECKKFTCTKTEHTAHTDDCLICGKTVHTTHTTACYEGVGDELTGFGLLAVIGATKSEGIIYGNTNKYICINDTWYSYTGTTASGSTAPTICSGIHTHTDACYKDEIHVHGDTCYTYTCGLTEHAHGDECYTKCTKLEHTHTNACNRNSTSNVIYVVSGKYEQTVGDVWPTADKFPSITLNGWTIDGITDSTAVSKRINMTSDLCDTSDNLKYATANTGGNKRYLYYMFESFDQTSPANGNDRILRNGVYYDKSELYYQEVNSSATWNQKQIMGMNAVSNGVVTSGSNVFLYYTRQRFTLKFKSVDKDVKMVENVMYEYPMKDLKDSSGNSVSTFVPDYPDTLEPNAYEFAGWYTTPQCFDGTEYDFANATMPNADVLLYAKWAPAKHTVRVFKTYDDIATGTTIGGDAGEQIVPHGNFVTYLPGTISNGNYVFNGWFYYDNGEKKAFDFNNMAIRKDMDIFAEWSSKVSVLYAIKYELEDGTKIADDKVGMMLAGSSKTFSAKAGTELYEGYQEGYFPNTNSHTILAKFEGTNEFTFVYKELDNVPYTVRYLEKDTGTVLHEAKYVSNNKKSVVTEKFEVVTGYMPDAYQKRLVLSQNPDENVLTFWYEKDDVNAYKIVIHWVENLDGSGYTAYRTTQGPDKIGNTITEEPITINGFEYKGYTVNNNYDGNGDRPDSLKSGNATGMLTANGLRLDLYYDRVETSYVVNYLEYGSNKVLKPQKQGGTVTFGETVTESYVEIDGYRLVSNEEQSLKISHVNAADNVITFYYTEKTVNITYVVAAGSGTLDRTNETVDMVTGTPQGSTPTASSGWHFDGWYKDAECTQPVDDSWVTSNKITPQKENGVHKDATYYAKFVANKADLTIEKTGVEKSDSNLTFMFNVKGNGVDIIVTVKGNGKVVIKDLEVGSYTVTEISDWSWRYEAVGDTTQTVNVVAGGAKVTFKNKLENKKWLDDETSVDNIYNGDTITKKEAN